ncbi:hypothetical protein P8452_66517 [Trifolium repens]|nr:hypothetical protein P8452_66517 [Trifolium repens]
MEFFGRPDGTWDSIEAERVQNEMDAFEAAFDTQQNTLPPSERADEVTRSGIMVDQFVEVVGGMPRNRLRCQGNTSSLVIRTPMGYRFDGSNSFGSVGSCSSATQSYSAADYQEMERRLKADNDARLQYRLDKMRLQLREEARQDMELMVQRIMSQRDQGYQPQQPQHPQHIPARHSTYASSNPHQHNHDPRRKCQHATQFMRPRCFSLYSLKLHHITSLGAVRNIRGDRLGPTHIRNSAIDQLLITINRRVKSYQLMLPLIELMLI